MPAGACENLTVIACYSYPQQINLLLHKVIITDTDLTYLHKHSALEKYIWLFDGIFQ